MADLSFLSDTDDSAVEELISQTQDLCVLEQISAINCSGFVDSVLPTDIESRFSRLKSFPATKPKPRASLPPSHGAGSARYDSNFTFKTQLNTAVGGKEESDHGPSDEDSAIFSHSKQNPVEKMGSESKSQSAENSGKKRGSKEDHNKRGSASLSWKSSNSSPENVKFPASKPSLDEKKCYSSQPGTGSFSSPLGSSNSSMDSPSPPKKAGCFWCSPKKASSRNKSKENWAVSTDFDWSKNDELLSDLGSFSFKEQQKILKNAMKEQKKINREAQKLVKLAKQASSRMISGIEDELSDD